MGRMFFVVIWGILLTGCSNAVLQPSNTPFDVVCAVGTDACEERASAQCATSFSVINRETQQSTVIPHYGQYPLTLEMDKLTVQCD
jgi:hypothetical protein